MREPLPRVTPFLRIGGREWNVPTALHALSHRNYRLYWVGQLISLTGTWMQTTAQQWLVYRLTGSPLALGTVTFLASLPVMLFSLFAGIAVDRVDKRRLLLLTQSMMMALALTLAGLTFAGVVQYWHVLAMATLLGLVSTFDMPTRQAFTVEMVGKEDLMNAIALNSSIFNGARLIGPAVAGLLVARVGEAMAFTLNGLSFLAVIAGLLLMRLPPFVPRDGRLRPLEDLKEGVSYIARNHAVMSLVIVAAIPSIFGFPYTALIPVMAGQVLGLRADGFGALVSSVGAGALVGAVSLAALGKFKRKGWLLTIATFTLAGAITAFALSRSAPLSMLALAFAGWSMVTHLATTNTLLQLQVPDALRGRVMSAYLWAVVGMAPLGSLLLGSLAEAWGAPRAILSGALVCLASALGMLAVFPGVRRLE
ncbi:MAG: MFS transporter [Anaerolineales bacterium]